MMKSNSHLPARPQGFSLVELLVVIGIMAVMLSVAAIGIQNVDKGQATVTGISQVQALMEETRNLAVGRNTRARLCIHAEPSEEERNLRFAVVAFERLTRGANGEITNREWVTESRGVYLPAGVYYHPRLTQQVASSVPDIGEVGQDSNVTFPGDPAKNVRNPNFFFWEFNSEGLCTQEGAINPGAAFVLCRGATGQGAVEPRVIGNDVGGFIVFRNGRTSAIRNTDIISNGVGNN